MPIKGQSPKQIVHTEMHKFKHGTLHSGSKHGPLVRSRKQAIAIALSESGQSRKRYGGRYADGGDIDNLPDVGSPAVPSGGQFSRGIPAVNKAADIGSQLGGNAVIGAATLPYRYPKAMVDAAMTQPGSEEAHQAYGNVGNVTGEMGLNMIGPKGGVPEGSTFGVFVGPYGAKALRERGYNEPHPAYAEAYKADPAFKPFDLRDIQAQEILQTEKLSPQQLADVHRQFGWSRGTEGKSRLEIPDTGAKLVKDPESDGYLLKHPAGDFHELYNIPPIQFDSKQRQGEGSFNPITRQIYVGGKPTQKNMKESMPQVLHEVQHAIQEKEGFAFGANPEGIMKRSAIFANRVLGKKNVPMNEFDFEYAPETHPMPSWQIDRIKRQIREKAGVDPESPKGQSMLEYARNLPQNRMEVAKQIAYERSAGETEARNVMTRYRNKNYSEYPEFTEDIPRGLQYAKTAADLIRDATGRKAAGGPIGNQKALPRPSGLPAPDNMDIDPNINDLRSEDRNAVHPDDIRDPPATRRFQFGGFNPERAESIGLSRKASSLGSGGLLKSQIPGRTDQIQASVPKGAYIIPADVVSGMGQGNTDAGGAILGKLMNRGPYNMNLPKRTAGSRVGTRNSSLKFSSKLHFADGGGSTDIPSEPILAAGGEYVVMPHEVAALGAGDVDTGHNILDAFVKHMREKTIQTMRKLPGPKGAKS